MDLEHKLRKVTSKTAVLYGTIALLVIFADPSWTSCFIGFIFVLAGEALRFWATGHLRKNEELTTSGPYAYLQSPLYLGSYIIGTGMCIMAMNPVIWILPASYSSSPMCRGSRRSNGAGWKRGSARNFSSTSVQWIILCPGWIPIPMGASICGLLPRPLKTLSTRPHWLLCLLPFSSWSGFFNPDFAFRMCKNLIR